MTAGRLKVQLTLAVFAALPLCGLPFGPAYAGALFGLGGILLLISAAADRHFAVEPVKPLLLALPFLALCWLSLIWSFDPHRSLRGALQLSGVLIGTAALWSFAPVFSPKDAQRLDRLMLILTLVASVYLLINVIWYYQPASAMDLPSSQTKYNRGLIYGLMLAWPQLAWRWNGGQGKKKLGFLLLLAVLMVEIGLGPSSTARMALVGGLGVWALASRWPGLVEKGLFAALLLLLPALPPLVRLLEGYRPELVGVIKFSAIHRLELWDYLSLHLLERPWQGWGLSTASLLPMTAEQAASYLWAKVPNYPHNQFLQIWVELGGLGMVAALPGLWGALRQVGKMSQAMRPFGYGAFASVIVVAMSDFEFTTDSWWAALAGMVLLFRLLASCQEA